jgi:hypothetical protein
MENLNEYLPVLIPLVVLQFGLMIAALIHIFRHQTYRIGNRILWVLISVILTIVGPALYFMIGRSDD